MRAALVLAGAAGWCGWLVRLAGAAGLLLAVIDCLLEHATQVNHMDCCKCVNVQTQGTKSSKRGINPIAMMRTCLTKAQNTQNTKVYCTAKRK